VASKTSFWTTTMRTFADMRSRAWCEPQLIILDLTLEALADEFEEASSRFDREAFMRGAKYRTDVWASEQPAIKNVPKEELTWPTTH
jgi:hypothetical protein